MSDEEMIYLPGDTIIFKMELEHNFNLGDSWAVFRSRSDSEDQEVFRMILDAKEIQEIRRVDRSIVSSVTFELEVSHRNSIPGIYDLEAIRSLPPGVERSNNRTAPEIEKPQSTVTFSIGQELSGGERQTGVMYWELSRPANTQRFYR